MRHNPARPPRDLDDTQRLYRKLDRLAQRHPEWAIARAPDEYERGRRLAPLFAASLRWIQRYLREGMVVFVHGRDGEIMAQLARRLGLRGVIYGITSRPLTQHATASAEVEAYLERLLPKHQHAAHWDTGYAGSIPRWMQDRGWNVTVLGMMHANNILFEIGCPGIDREKLRRLVNDEVEGGPQRLLFPKEGWGKFRYSRKAPDFWALVYGACDALGIPR